MGQQLFVWIINSKLLIKPIRVIKVAQPSAKVIRFFFASGRTKTGCSILLPNKITKDFGRIESCINRGGHHCLDLMASFKLLGALCFIYYDSCFFLSQTSIKWSQPDEDNKCLGEVHLTIDPKYRGMSTGS